MYNQKFINLLLNILACMTAILTVIFFISGFVVASQYSPDNVLVAASWLGYELSGLAIIAFFYSVLGVLYRSNNK